MPIPMPHLFREALEKSAVVDVDRWWQGIDEPSRENAITYWNMIATEQVDRFHLAAVVESEEPIEHGYWSDDFYEYLINHEVTWFETPRQHICHATAAAQECLREGRLPADFACPISVKDCLMMKLLAESKGTAIRFWLVPERASWRPESV